MKIHSKNHSYWIGFGLSMIFTTIPFYIMQYNIFEKNISLIIIVLCAIIQIYIHLTYFLHLGCNMLNQEWYIVSLIFTIFIVLILVLGSIWIMTHLHYNLIM